MYTKGVDNLLLVT